MFKLVVYIIFIIACCTGCSKNEYVNRIAGTGMPLSEIRCAEEMTANACTFYLCREKINPCGINGYYLGYGYNYCEVFSGSFHYMSPAGKDWINCTKKCLISFIADGIQDKESCESVNALAFESHSPCYTDCGFCSLPATDIDRVRMIVEGNSSIWEDVQVMLQCLQFPPPPATRGFQNSCIADMGACRQGKKTSDVNEIIHEYNEICRKKTGYSGPDLRPSDDDCSKYFY